MGRKTSYTQLFGFDTETTFFKFGEKPKFLFCTVYNPEFQAVFKTRKDFWKWVFSLTENTVVVAHNLQFDLEMVLPIERVRKYEVLYAHNSKPSFTRLKFKVDLRRHKKGGRGKSKGKQRTVKVLFVDLANFVGRTPLEKVAEIFCPNVPKLERPSESEMSVDNPKAVEYCLRDSEIVYRVYRMFWERWGVGVSLPSVAGKQFKKILEIESRRPLWVKKYERESYFGGRTEVFCGKPCEYAYKLDVNSMYPFVMTQPLPFRFEKALSGKERLEFIEKVKKGRWKSRKYAYLVHALVRTTKPVLPKRFPNKRVVFPIGEFEGVWWLDEIMWGVEHGYTEITGLPKILVYEKTDRLSGRMLELYRQRMETPHKEEKTLIKLFMNSGYGKLAQRERETIPLPNELAGFVEDGEDVEFDGKVWVCREYGEGDFQLERKTEDEARGGFTAFSSFVASQARIVLLNLFERANWKQIYSDTDSITIDESLFPLFEDLIGEGLGKLKIEDEGKFVPFSPKVYIIANTFKVKGVPIHKAIRTDIGVAGTPLGYREYPDRFEFEYTELVKPREAKRRNLQPFSLIEVKKEINTLSAYSKAWVLEDRTIVPFRLNHNGLKIEEKALNKDYVLREYKEVIRK